MGALIVRAIWVGGLLKTTIEISDSLLREARDLAEREGVTLRALVERGLNRVISETKQAAAFKLRRTAFKGKGLQEEFRAASFDIARDEIFRGCGGTGGLALGKSR